MIEHLRGTLLTREPGHAVVECAGVGYGVEVPHTTFEALPEVGAEVQLAIHFRMTETEMTLYGFATEVERRLFRTFIGVQSIGPRLALVLLSTLTPDELVQAVREGDLTLLTSVPGIGKKTAERLVVELRDPLAKLARAWAAEGPRSPTPTADESEGEPVPGVDTAMRDQAVAALVALGTKPAEAARAVSRAARALEEEPSVEALVKEALKKR